MPLTIIRNDITKMTVDAIVNAANTELTNGGGACGAIFTAAGADQLQKACFKLSPIKTGDVAITKGFSLPAKYILHAAGPSYKDGNHGEESLLRSCYINSLNIAKIKGCKSIAFPLISSGVYGYPKDEALNVATNAISEWLVKHDLDVYLVVFDKTAFVLSTALLGEVKSFIDQNYVDKSNRHFVRSSFTSWDVNESYESEALSQSVDFHSMEFTQALPTASEITENFAPVILNTKQTRKPFNEIVELDEPFTTTLLKLIDAKGKTDVEVYKRANLDRKLFSKIRKGKGYMPSKKTVVALAVALELSLPETNDLLRQAGFALSRSVMFDVIIEYFISEKKYDIFSINNVLFEYDQQLLGG